MKNISVLSRRTALVILLSLLILSVVVRYPLVEHERNQTDSYFVHRITASILTEGQAVWIFHPLSYVGYYPASYPTGYPMVLAETAAMCGLSVELSILISSLVFGILFCLVAFCLSRMLLTRFDYAMLATFFIVTGARFIDTTYWGGSCRGPAVVFIVMTIFAAFQMRILRRSGSVAIVILMVFAAFAIHHMAIFIVAFAAAYAIVDALKRIILPRTERRRKEVTIAYFSSLLIAITVVSYSMIQYLRSQLVWNLSETGLISIEPVFASVLLNIAVVYTNQIGFVVPIALMGAVRILRGRHQLARTLFPVAVLLAFVPLLGSQLYVSMVISPFVAVLGATWLSRFKPKRNAARRILILGLVVTSLVLPYWSIDRWNGTAQITGDTVIVDDQVFNDGTYLSGSFGGEDAISNSGTLAGGLSAFSDMRFLGSGIHLAINGELNASDLSGLVDPSDQPFPTNLYVWFSFPDKYDVGRFVLRLMYFGVYSVAEDTQSEQVTAAYFESHSHLVVVVDNNWKSSFVNQYNVLKSTFLIELRRAEWSVPSTPALAHHLPSYLVYQSERVSAFVVELPD